MAGVEARRGITVAIRVTSVTNSAGTVIVVVPGGSGQCIIGGVVIVAVVVVVRVVVVAAAGTLDLGHVRSRLFVNAAALGPTKETGVTRRVLFQLLVCCSRLLGKGDGANAGGFSVETATGRGILLAEWPPRTLEWITDRGVVKVWSLGVLRLQALCND